MLLFSLSILINVPGCVQKINGDQLKALYGPPNGLHHVLEDAR